MTIEERLEAFVADERHLLEAELGADPGAELPECDGHEGLLRSRLDRDPEAYEHALFNRALILPGATPGSWIRP